MHFHNLPFSDISLLTFSFHHHVCFLHMPFFVHLQVFSVADSKPCFNLDQISSTCSPEVSSISLVKVSQNLSWRSACWSFHTRRFGTNFLHQSSLFTILVSQTISLCWVTHSSFGMTFTSLTNLVFCRLPRCNQFDFDFHQIDMLPDDSPFS